MNATAGIDHTRTFAPGVSIGTRAALAAALFVAAVPTQDDPPDPAPRGEEAAAPATDGRLEWPRDAERVVCVVGGEEHTLRDVLQHIGERHYPGMVALMDEVTGQAYLGSPAAATWIRQYADVRALEMEARSRGADPEQAAPLLSAALKQGFERYLERYTAIREQRGRPVELTQERVDLLLTDYQRNEGLQTEVQGWLDFLVEEVDTDNVGQLRDYYNLHPQYFGGVLTIAQIMIRHRDPDTLQLLPRAERQEAFDKLAEVRSRLGADDASFEELARRYSDDRVTAARGGVMQGVERFDDRLPAALCRTAWSLKDGEVSEPIETPYGIHLIKRIGYRHLYYILFTERIYGDIANTIRRDRQESTLFEARERHGVTLRY